VTAEPLGVAAARAQKGLRIFIRSDATLGQIKSKLTGKGDGEVSIVCQREAGDDEIELRLPGGYPISAQITNDLKAIPGVLSVEHF
jgi:DNA polymerase III subunit alpha